MGALPFVEVPFAYANGLKISNNATTPNTKFDIALGQCRDSTDTYQIVLPAGITVNAATTGLNALDTGTLAASTVYFIHLVSDPVTLQATGAVLSLSATAPLLPFGYSAFKHIGSIVTDSSVHFLPGYWTGGGQARTFLYDAPQATAITAGAATSYTAVDLSAVVPGVVDGRIVYINTAFTPGAASRTLSMQPTGGTGDAVTVTGQVTSVVVTTQSILMSKLSSSAAKISYKVANGTDAVNIKVAGYDFSI
jgi:hypothetical protein